jgi:hypothetical protein
MMMTLFDFLGLLTALSELILYCMTMMIMIRMHDDSDDGNNDDNCVYSLITCVLYSLLVWKKEGILDILLTHTHYY